MVKIYILLVNKRDLNFLLRQMKNFWRVNEKEIFFKRYSFLYRLLIRTFLIGILFSCIIFFFKPFLPGHSLPVEVWVPNSHVLNFNFIYVCKIFVMFYAIVSDIASDILFQSFCITILIQLKLLNRGFSEIKFENRNLRKKHFGECVRHHIFLSQ